MNLSDFPSRSVPVGITTDTSCFTVLDCRGRHAETRRAPGQKSTAFK